MTMKNNAVINIVEHVHKEKCGPFTNRVLQSRKNDDILTFAGK